MERKDGFKIASNREINRQDLLTLLERSNGNNPIDAKQLTTFIRYPNGAPPDLCVGLSVFPDEFASVDQAEPRMYVNQLARTPSGDLVALTVTSEGIVVARVPYVWTPYTIPTNGRKVKNVRLLGYDKSESPVVVMDIDEPVRDVERAVGYQPRLLHLMGQTIEGEFLNATFSACSDVVYFVKHSQPNGGECHVRRVGQIGGKLEDTLFSTLGVSGFARDFVETEQGLLCVMERHEGNCVININTRETVGNTVPVRHLTKVGDTVFMITEGGSLMNLHLEGQRAEPYLGGGVLEEPGCVYKRGLYRLKDGRKCYVAKTRDMMERWVIDRVPQAAFDLVSPLFEGESDYFYYAYIEGRRQILKMAISKF